MRLAAAALLLLLSACSGSRSASDEAAYGQALTLLRAERFQEAGAVVDARLRQGRATSSQWNWKLRLLRVEILLARREGKQAEAALDFQLPEGPQWTADRARYRLCQGYAAVLLNESDRARQRLDEAEALARSAGDPSLLAEIELRQGYLAIKEGRFADADRLLHRVLASAAQQNDAWLRMNATGNLGWLLLRSFRYEQAIPSFEKTLALARALHAAQSQARCIGNLGWCYYRLGDLDKALDYFQQADSAFESAGIRSERQTWLGNIGSIYLSREEYPAAADYYQRALAIAQDLGDRANSSTWLRNLAFLSLENGDTDKAERYNNEALALKRELNDGQGELYALVNAGGIALARRESSRSAALFREVIHRAPDDPSLGLDAHAGLAEALAEAGQRTAAEAEFRAAIAALERQRSALIRDEYRLTWFSSLIRFYRAWVDFLIAGGNSREALAVADSSRARVLSDRLRLSQVRVRRAPGDFEEIARATGSTLLSYWVAPRGSFLWVITPAGISVFPLPSESELSALVAAHNGLISDLRDPASVADPAGEKLYGALVAPAERAIRRTSKVILVADGPLYALNFETLPVPGSPPHYWIEDAAVSVAPSLGLLTPDRRGPERTGGSLLLIGNPVSQGPEFPELRFAKQEMDAVQDSVRGFRKVVYEKADARVDAWSRAHPAQFTLIHFAAHAVANREDPLRSAVILSPAGDRYRLLASDVLHTPIQADLVTLSACRSAGARAYAGEGLVGFSWAFLDAGARNVIAGLWDVNDRSTAMLMRALYSELAAGRPPNEALRSAKVSLIHSTGVYRKPWYWGAFELFTVKPQAEGLRREAVTSAGK